MGYLTGGRVECKGTNENNTKEGFREGSNGASRNKELSRTDTY